jgi:hypothetical protein
MINRQSSRTRMTLKLKTHNATIARRNFLYPILNVLHDDANKIQDR